MTGEGKMMFFDVINNSKKSSGNTHIQRSPSAHSSLLGATRTTSSDPPLPIEDEPSLEEIRSWRKHNGLLSTMLRIFGPWVHTSMKEPLWKNDMDEDNQRIGPIRMGRPKEVLVLGEDHFGRRIVKRGTEVFIEEPVFNGRQWEGAEEMDDETDEPYLLGLV